jgi:hypothetical protein
MTRSAEKIYLSVIFFKTQIFNAKGKRQIQKFIDKKVSVATHQWAMNESK